MGPPGCALGSGQSIFSFCSLKRCSQMRGRGPCIHLPTDLASPRCSLRQRLRHACQSVIALICIWPGSADVKAESRLQETPAHRPHPLGYTCTRYYRNPDEDFPACFSPTNHGPRPSTLPPCSPCIPYHTHLPGYAILHYTHGLTRHGFR